MSKILVLIIVCLVGCSTSSRPYGTITLRENWEYHKLASRYGYQFTPKVQGDEAIPIDHAGCWWRLDRYHMTTFQHMRDMAEEGRP